MTWRIHNPRNGLWLEVVNDAGMTFDVARESSAKELVAYLNALKRLADFGTNCMQDDYEGAWIAATVHNQVKKDLQEALAVLQATVDNCGCCEELCSNCERVKAFIDKAKGRVA